MEVMRDEANIRVEVTNDIYHGVQDGHSVEMEEDNRMDLDLNVNDEIESLETHITVPVTAVSLSTKDTSPGRRSDGECTSASDSDDDMEVGDFSNSRKLKKRGSADGTSESTLPGPRQPRQYHNPYLSEEGKKRLNRAIRFHDSPLKFANEINMEIENISEENLLKFYKNCSLMSDDWGELSMEKVGPQFRLDSILIRGINNMSTDEVFTYLHEMGLVPQAMEWVNDACCIVVYKDKFEAAGSLLKATKPIAVNQDALEKKKSLLIEEKPLSDSQDGEKTLEEKRTIHQGADYDALDIIPHEDILVPMPLGYVWRYARPCAKAKGVLMRFATTQDRKQERAEKFSEYYKRHGNPNFKNIDDDFPAPNHKSKRNSKRSSNPDIEDQSDSVLPTGDSGDDAQEGSPKKFNAWGKLSEAWGEEEKTKSDDNRRANTPMPSRHSVPYNRKSFGNEDLRKKGYVNFKITTGFTTSNHRSGDNSRKRGWNSHRDDFTGRNSIISSGRLGNKSSADDDDDDEKWTSRLKGPTMRMHADEEESRMKLQARKKNAFKSKTSVSSRLGYVNRNREAFSSSFEEDDDSSPAKRPVKERLGAKPSNAADDDELEDYYEVEEYEEGDEEEDLEALLQDD